MLLPKCLDYLKVSKASLILFSRAKARHNILTKNITSPSQRPNFFGSKSSSQEKSSSQTYGTEYVSTMTNEHTSLSRSAFEDFKQHQRAVEQGSYVSAGAGMPTTVNAMSPVASSIPLEYMEPSYRPTSQGRHRQHLEDDEEEMLHEQKVYSSRISLVNDSSNGTY